MNKYRLPVIIIGTLILVGCSSYSKIIVDTQGLDLALYHKDLKECQQLAEEVETNIITGIIGGAIVGAIIGEISGGNIKAHHNSRRHYRHHNRHYSGAKLSTAGTAQLGAVGGGLLAGTGDIHKRDRVLKNCMVGRGYRLLN